MRYVTKLNNKLTNYIFSIAQFVICWTVIADAWVRSPLIPRDTCNLQIGLNHFFLPVFSFSPVSTIPPLLHNQLHINTVLIRRTNERYLGTLKQSTVLPDIWELWAKNYVAFV